MTDVNKYVIGKCDICEIEQKVMAKYGNMLFCESCWFHEEEATKELMKPENQVSRIQEMNQRIEEQRSKEIGTIGINEVLRTSRQIDSSIQIRTDLFNAATVSIIELKKSIYSDESIINKPYQLAEELQKRFEHFKNIVFELNTKLVEAGNEQRAIQVYLNQLANSLRAEEREKLRLADISYTPTSPKVVKAKAVTTRQTKKSTKIDKVELRKYANELSVSEFMLQMLVVQKGISVSDAAKILKKSIDLAKSASNKE